MSAGVNKLKQCLNTHQSNITAKCWKQQQAELILITLLQFCGLICLVLFLLNLTVLLFSAGLYFLDTIQTDCYKDANLDISFIKRDFIR